VRVQSPNVRASRPSLVVALLLLHFACGNPIEPSEVTGNWSARYGGHFDYIEMQLMRQGSEVTGVACSYSGVTLAWSGQPVAVTKDNRVTFQPPPPYQQTQGTFVGKFTSDRKLIQGSYTAIAGGTFVFERGGSGTCAFAH
jgi:hypothetical protein